MGGAAALMPVDCARGDGHGTRARDPGTVGLRAEPVPGCCRPVTLGAVTERSVSPGESPGPEPSNRAVPFLAAFNDIENHLRTVLQARKSDGFRWMVRLAEKKHLISDAHSEALQAFADLRNAISHGTYNNYRPIAEPLPETVEQISRIRDLILDPPTALGVLGGQRVRLAAPGDPIRGPLAVIRSTDISQFPVYDADGYVALLTTNTIARWVAADLDDNDHLDARTVAEVLDYAERSDCAVFLPRDASAQEVVDAMRTPDRAGNLPRAILLTEHGRRHQKPLRVVGGADLGVLLDALEVP